MTTVNVNVVRNVAKCSLEKLWERFAFSWLLSSLLFYISKLWHRSFPVVAESFGMTLWQWLDI